MADNVRNNQRIAYPTNFTNINTYALYLNLVKENEPVDVDYARTTLFPQMKTPRKDENGELKKAANDTHTRLQLETFKLIDFVSEKEFRVSTFGRRFLELFDINDDEIKVKSEMEYNLINVCIEMLLNWRDENNGRSLNFGLLFLTLLLDKRIGNYITPIELSSITKDVDIANDLEYDKFVERILDIRKNNIIDIKIDKADTFLSGLVNTWKILENNRDDKNKFYLTNEAKKILIEKLSFLYKLKEEQKNMNKAVYVYSESEGFNLVIYGTPGCGKSYMLNEKLKKDRYIDNDGNEQNGLNISEDRIIRTTFHHDYSNTDFVGQIVPQVDRDGSATYVINPGPFTKALTLAFQSDKKVALVIEELNRGDAAGILGDIFQLLDRYKETDTNKEQYKGVSQYPIENNLIQAYLTEHTNYKFDNIRIPSNLYIFATMNTSDQNVFTLDTAFKRRWDFLKMKNNYIKYDEDCGNEILYVPGSNKKWTDFVDQLNKKMLKLNGQINEDKQLGLYFVDKDLLAKKENEYDEEKTKKFAFKVLEYLWDDVVRYDHTELFDNKIETLDDLVDKFIKYAKDNKESTLVFKDDTFNQNENE